MNKRVICLILIVALLLVACRVESEEEPTETPTEAPVVSHVLNDTQEAVDYLMDLLDRYVRKEIECVAYDLEYDTLIESAGMSRQEANRLSTLDVFNPDCKLQRASAKQ